MTAVKVEKTRKVESWEFVLFQFLSEYKIYVSESRPKYHTKITDNE